jgi:hypothetical protein
MLFQPLVEGEIETVGDEKFEYTRTLLISGNVAILVWTIIATIATWFYFQAIAWVFLLLDVAIVFLFLRRLGCSTCVYCKTCTMGFGRLAGWFFGKRELKDLSNKTAVAFVAIAYVFLSLVPAAVLTVSLVQAFDPFKMAVLLSLLAISIFSLATWSKTRKQKAGSS